MWGHQIINVYYGGSVSRNKIAKQDGSYEVATWVVNNTELGAIVNSGVKNKGGKEQNVPKAMYYNHTDVVDKQGIRLRANAYAQRKPGTEKYIAGTESITGGQIMTLQFHPEVAVNIESDFMRDYSLYNKNKSLEYDINANIIGSFLGKSVDQYKREMEKGNKIEKTGTKIEEIEGLTDEYGEREIEGIGMYSGIFVRHNMGEVRGRPTVRNTGEVDGEENIDEQLMMEHNNAEGTQVTRAIARVL